MELHVFVCDMCAYRWADLHDQLGVILHHDYSSMCETHRITYTLNKNTPHGFALELDKEQINHFQLQRRSNFNRTMSHS